MAAPWNGIFPFSVLGISCICSKTEKNSLIAKPFSFSSCKMTFANKMKKLKFKNNSSTWEIWPRYSLQSLEQEPELVRTMMYIQSSETNRPTDRQAHFSGLSSMLPYLYESCCSSQLTDLKWAEVESVELEWEEGGERRGLCYGARGALNYSM